MSVRALSWALNESPVENKVELLVLIVLCDHAHDDGDGAYPSVARIARMARASESGVDVALKSLRRAGLIEAKPRPGRPTIYRIVMTPPATGPLQPVDPSSRWTPPLQPVDPTPPAGGPEPLREPSIEPSSVVAESHPLCELLADLIVENGSKRPTITEGWATAERLLITRDGRPREQAEQLIRWCQADGFWRSNILSMPTFRAKYDQLRLRSESDSSAARRETPSDILRAMGAAA